MPIVSICGNIGSGKSTVVSHLKANGYNVHYEPVADMEQLLTKFYVDMPKWAFHLQAKVLLLYRQLKEKMWQSSSAVHIVERSPLESKHVFAECLRRDGVLTDVEFELYNELYDAMAWEPDAIILLKAMPSVCMSRILERERSCEANITLDYLTKLDSLYGDISEMQNVLSVDANGDPESVAQDVLRAINSLV